MATTEHETPLTSAFTPAMRGIAETMIESETHVGPARPVFEVTSNIRQGSRTPEQPSIDNNGAFLLRRSRDPIIDHPVFGLPPPDIAPRFVFRPDTSYVEDTPPSLSNDGFSDAVPPMQSPIHTPSSAPPRIYFGPSAITFVPPVSYDFLERDPSVKGVPRNYRAWARAGRPKLDLEGAERADARGDFLAIGLVLPQDSDSENVSDEGEEIEKRRRRRKKKQMAKVVPMDRPRRTAGRKLMETVQSSTPPLHTKLFIEKAKRIGHVAHTMEMKKGPSSKTTEDSDKSGRRSSSTLLDTEVANKRKRFDLGKEGKEIPAAKRARVSKRLHVKKYGPQDNSASSQPTSDEDDQTDDLFDPSPSPRSSASSAGRPAATPVSVRRGTSSLATHLHSRKHPGQTSKSRTDGSPRSLPLPASRPGHRLSRTVLPNCPHIPNRTFPPSVTAIHGYSCFYRRYPLVTQFHPDDPVGKYINKNDTQAKRQVGNWNPPRDHRDLYTPRYTRGTGGKKIALCPICFEDPSRGGEGRQEWNHTKTSQHNYHMQYYHGISATRCAPFSPPVAHRVSPIARPQTNEKAQILQGKCHVCKQWVALEGCKVGELKVKELLWWKHAAQCHKDSKLAGEEDVFIEDEAYRLLKEYEAGQPVQV